VNTVGYEWTNKIVNQTVFQIVVEHVISLQQEVLVLESMMPDALQIIRCKKAEANHNIYIYKLHLNFVALVRERTIPTERPPLVGEVSANFCGLRMSRGQRNGFPRSLISVF
jgi:hypothetical protein